MAETTLLQSGVRDVECGAGARIVEPSNVCECTLGDDGFVGPFVEIQRGSRIGTCGKVQSHAFICELATIGEDCFVDHGLMFLNDLFAVGGTARGRHESRRSITIGNRGSIGFNATMLAVRVCDDVVMGAGAMVTRGIERPGICAGNPARLLRKRSPSSPRHA